MIVVQDVRSAFSVGHAPVRHAIRLSQEGMNPRTRMFKVWGWLVASMTCGAGLLLWLEPDGPVLQRSLSLEACKRQARQAVASRDTARADWLGIEILPIEPDANRDRISLTATEPQHDVHFVVTPAGYVVPNGDWRRQVDTQGQTRVRIGIEWSAADRTLARAQVLSLRSLVGELNGMMTEQGIAPLPVRVDELLGGLPLAIGLQSAAAESSRD